MNQRLANRRQGLRRSGSAGPAARPTELSLRLNDVAKPDARSGMPHGPAAPASGSLINGSPATGRSCGNGESEVCRARATKTKFIMLFEFPNHWAMVRLSPIIAPAKMPAPTPKPRK